MMEKIVLAGFGGQGVMFIGKILTVSGMVSNLEVCYIPSYGPEMRGGTANCSVILSDQEIHSPVIDVADGGIVLNQPSYEKFLGKIKPDGVLVVNSSMVKIEKSRDDIEIIQVPVTEMARELGNPSIANMISLGALLPKLSLTNIEKIEKALEEVVGTKRPELLELNLTAIRKGMEN